MILVTALHLARLDILPVPMTKHLYLYPLPVLDQLEILAVIKWTFVKLHFFAGEMERVVMGHSV